MKKKLLAMLLALSVVLALCACGVPSVLSGRRPQRRARPLRTNSL